MPEIRTNKKFDAGDIIVINRVIYFVTSCNLITNPFKEEIPAKLERGKETVVYGKYLVCTMPLKVVE